MPRLFGTDGVRGVANRDLTPDLALALGRAAGRVLAPDGGRVVIGRDTRLSGPMLESALVAGLLSAGSEPYLLGVVPTPAVAFATVAEGARAGGVVSASHNPVPDNGIKFFAADGTKIDTEVEDAIEALLEEPPAELPEGSAIASAVSDPAGVRAYAEHLVGSVDSLVGLKIVLDCAFGSAWSLAPEVFRAAGAEVIAMNDEPDGSRINVDCGSTSLEGISKQVVESGADFGLAFDGDADRVLACDETGAVVDGDRIIALSAVRMHELGTLKNDLVVVTVMANLGFRRALQERGIEIMSVPVGDRHVVAAMNEHGAVLGGEQSGHVVFSEFSTTGDGILTGLQVAAAVSGSGEPLSALAHVFEPVPQVLLNVGVADRAGLDGAQQLWEQVRAVEESFGDDGRVLLRPSGTEPLVRVMVEHVDERVANEEAARLAEAVKTALG